MVGRDDELSEVARAWRHVTARRAAMAQTVVITGAAGTGKSLLVASILATLAPRPHAVLSGTARVHTPAPYDWLAAVLTGRDTGRIPIPADALAWLAQHPDVPRERYPPGALLRLAVRTVRELIGSGPAALIVEDVHALDPASLNLIGELATAPELPALLVVTSRPPESAVSPQLAARTLARLAGTPHAIRQHLGPLCLDGVRAVLAQRYPHSPLSADLVHAVRERTDGNPYSLRELLVTVGAAGPQALAHEPLPAHLPLPRSAGESALTAREIEVLACLAEGMSNKQVARSLGISIRTVAVHVSNLLLKTRSASRTEAALWAVQHRVSAPH